MWGHENTLLGMEMKFFRKKEYLMNTFQDLIDNGIDEHTAISMLDNYSSRIGTVNGIYKITDIEYDFNIKGRIVTLQCSECGKVIHRTMIKGRNKWSELIKTCECQKILKIKKEQEEKQRLIDSRLNKSFGDYEICGIDYDEMHYMARCRQCGNVVWMNIDTFDRKKDFHCTKHFNPIKYDESYIGRKYNFLEIIGIERDSKNHRKFKCRCDCGNVKLLEPFDVAEGTVKSCGCKHDELLSIHGLSGTRLYSIRQGMKARCYNEKSTAYENYGGRGIGICREWLNDENGLQNFVDWALSNGYSDDLTIDRIDVNGNYDPGNCRWADWETQCNNKRPYCECKPRKKRFEVDGERYTMSELCNMYNITEPAIRYRIKVLGMTLEQALKNPKEQKKNKDISIRLSDDLYSRIENFSNQKEKSVSEVVREILKSNF